MRGIHQLPVKRIFHGFFVVRLDIIFLCCSLCNDHSLVMKSIHTKHTSRIYRQSEYRNCAHCFVQAIVQAFTTAYDRSKEGTLRNEVMSSNINVYWICVYCNICIAMGYHFLLFLFIPFFHIILIQIKRNHVNFFTSRLNCYHMFQKWSQYERDNKICHPNGRSMTAATSLMDFPFSNQQ